VADAGRSYEVTQRASPG